MTLEVEVQDAAADPRSPRVAEIRRWAQAAYRSAADAEVVVRIVGETEGAELNSQYRGRSGPTNVLSFEFEAPPGVDSGLLGDLVICAPVVLREAESQAKPAAAHWAHMVVHGMLHLQGYEHQAPVEAAEMESLETEILAELGFAPPYEGS